MNDLHDAAVRIGCGELLDSVVVSSGCILKSDWRGPERKRHRFLELTFLHQVTDSSASTRTHWFTNQSLSLRLVVKAWPCCTDSYRARSRFGCVALLVQPWRPRTAYFNQSSPAPTSSSLVFLLLLLFFITNFWENWAQQTECMASICATAGPWNRQQHKSKPLCLLCSTALPGFVHRV